MYLTSGIKLNEIILQSALIFEDTSLLLKGIIKTSPCCRETKYKVVLNLISLDWDRVIINYHNEHVRMQRVKQQDSLLAY